jgi:hypothetical protein
MTEGSVTADPGLASRLLAAIEAELPAAAELRHQIPREPDLGGYEERTATRTAPG